MYIYINVRSGSLYLGRCSSHMVLAWLRSIQPSLVPVFSIRLVNYYKPGILTLRQILENGHIFRRLTIPAFLDFKAVFDSVDQALPWRSRCDVRLSIKGRVDTATVSLVLFYGSETWPLIAEHMPRLSVFECRCLRIIARI